MGELGLCCQLTCGGAEGDFKSRASESDCSIDGEGGLGKRD